MDITYFMTWFISQIVSIFTFVFTTLNNITFSGTSLLKVLIFINIIIPFIYIIITIPQKGANSIHEYNVNIRKENQKQHDKANGIKRGRK